MANGLERINFGGGKAIAAMLPITKATVEHFCLICLQEFHEGTSKKDYKHNIENEEDFMKYLRITANISETLYDGPTCLCHTCFTKTNVFYEFREKAICSAEALKELIDEMSDNLEALRNLQQFCRTCLKKLRSDEKAQVYIYENVEVKKWLLDCTGLFICPENDLKYVPRCICNYCYRKLRNYTDYRRIAQQSYEYLGSILGNINEGATEQASDVLNNASHEPDQEPGVLMKEVERTTDIFVEQLPPLIASDSENEYEISAADNTAENDKDNDVNGDVGKTSEMDEGEKIMETDKNNEMRIEKEKKVDTLPLMRKKTKVNGVTQTVYKCENCDKKFRKEFIYKAHIRSVHEGVEKAFNCEICQKSFRLYHYLRRHIREKHTPSKKQLNNASNALDESDVNRAIESSGYSLSCAICCRAFKRKDHLVHHIRSVHAKLRPYKCKYCEKAFGARKTLRVHEMGHTNTRPFECEFCHKRFIQSTELKSHREVHTTKPELLCPICKRAKSSVEALKEHIAQHNAAMQHQCPKCGKIFKKRSHLTEHDNTVHLKLRPFKCSHCEATFGFRKTCRIHERIHTGERPEICSICQKGFTQPSSLRAHMKKHENVENSVKEKKRKSQKSVS